MDTQTKEPSKNTSNEVYKENKGNNHNESQQIISAPPHQKSADQEEIDALKDSYDDFLYVSKAFSNCAINSLIAKARLYGLNPAPINGAPVSSSLAPLVVAISSLKRCTIQKQLSQA